VAWIEIPDSDIGVGSYAREDLVLQRFRNNLRELRRGLFPWIFAEASTGSSSWVPLTGTTVALPIPNLASYSGLTRKVRLICDVKISGGGTGEYRLRETVSGNTGTAVTGITATSYTAQALEIAVDASWLDTVRTFEVQAQKISGGTAFAQAPGRIAGTVFY